MTNKGIKAAAALTAWILVTPAATAQPPSGSLGEGLTSPAARKYLAEAVVIAGDDMKAEATALCRAPRRNTAVPPPPPGAPKPPPFVSATKRVSFEPTRVFDNVYYVGTSQVGATAIKTSAGIILIDTLNNSEDAESILIPGLKALGLDVSQIKYVVITHGHGDHHGGLNYLRTKAPGARAVMAEDDWAFVKKPFYMPNGALDTAPAPTRKKGDIGFRETYRLTLGDFSMRLIETPGHTPGTVSLLYPVKQGDKTYNLMQWGGGGPTNAEFSLKTVEDFIAVAKAAKPSVLWSSHSGSDWQSKLAALRSGAGGENPFVMGEAKVGRYLDLVVACKHAIVAQAGS